MNLLAPWALGGLVLVPVIVLLQLLAPKARRVVVSWLHPWEGFARAASGGAARWRMRLKSPALWLELAILLFLVLSLARPVVMVESSRHPVVRLVVDRSATMAIRDRGAHAFGGANSAGRRMSRWEFARGMVAGLLKNIPAGAKVELVVVPAEQTGAEVLQLDAGEVAAHLNRRGPLLKFAAPQWAQEHLLPPTGSMPVIVVTDVAPGDTGEGVFVLATGAAGQSGAAIVRAGARVEDGRWFVLVALRNGADRRRTVSLSIEASDGERWEKKIALAPNGRWRRVIEMAGSPPDGVTVRAEAGADNFEADNVAYLARRRASAVKVALVGREDPSLRKALLSAGGVEVIEAASADAVTPESVDVVVFVDTAASEDWGGPACFVNPRASIGPIRVGGGSGPVPEDTWVVRNRDSGLGRWLYLPGPKVKRLQNVDLIGDAEVVVGEKERPMVVAWQGDSELKKRIAVLFDISSDGTDWPLLPSYPVFWAGVLASLVPGPRHTGDVYVTHSPHESVEFMRPNRGAGSGQRLGRASRSSPGFIRDGRGGGEGEIVAGVSFIADKERKWLSGPMVDQTRAATEAIGEVLARSATAGRRELWPLLAIFAAVATLLRLFWLR